VTGDHSMVIFRDGIQMVVKPSEILKTDKILCLENKEFIEQFEIQRYMGER
jgi:hypothetical protein